MLLALRDDMPGWLARRRLKRLAAHPDAASLEALVRALRPTRQGPEGIAPHARAQQVLDHLCEALEAVAPRLLVEACLPGLSAAQRDALAPGLGRDLRLRLHSYGACDVAMLTEAGERMFRALPTSRRRGLHEVRPWRLEDRMACPVCDREGQLERRGSTITGRTMHEFYCAACSWMIDDDRGPAMWAVRDQLAAREAAARPAPAPATPSSRTGDVRIRLTITDVLGFYDDRLGTYVGDPDPARHTTQVSWFRVPAAWLEGDRLAPRRLREIYGFYYGEDWLYDRERRKYVVLESDVKILEPSEEAARSWLDGKRIYVTTSEGSLVAATPESF